MKTSVKNDIFGSGFGEPSGTPPPIIPRRTPVYYSSILGRLSQKIIFSQKNKNKNSFYEKMRTQVSPQYSCVDENLFLLCY